MPEDLELAVHIIVKQGARHAFVEWLPSQPEAAELAISFACEKAAAGYRFHGIQNNEAGGQQLWLVEESAQDSPAKRK